MKRFPSIAHRGVALVITLIMLSVVTIVAVTFLAVTRRERSSVTAADEQTEANYLVEAALARAQADIAARMAASGSRVDFAAFVSTNYVRPAGFDPNASPMRAYAAYDANPTNVAYTNLSGRSLRFDVSTNGGSRDEYRKMLANLMHDPRPPVFVTTNSIRGTLQDFRYYLDLNRNGYFEPPSQDIRVVGTVNGNNILHTNTIPGDPQWIGLLEHPHLPHSATNRFVGRIAYLVLPAGLDLNYIHNRAKNLGQNESFSRNQGLGSWEINLAALLDRVDARIWSNYAFNADPAVGSVGNSFADANAVVQYRIAPNTKETLTGFLRPDEFHPLNNVASPLNRTFLDLYANGPIVRSVSLPPSSDNVELGARPWEGSDSPRQFQSLQDLFRISPGMSTRLRGAVPRVGNLITNDWTLYRLLSEVGTDSPDGRFYTAFDARKGYYRRAKLNLNYSHGDDGEIQKPTRGNIQPNAVGTFRPWEPVEFFTNAVDRLLESGLHYQGVTFRSDRIPVRYFGVSVVTNPPGAFRSISYVTNRIQYGADIHRLLQMAANLYESVQNRSNLAANVQSLPTVFRPRFGYLEERFDLDRTTFILTTNLYIIGWAQVTNAAPIVYPWVDPDSPLDLRNRLTRTSEAASLFQYDPTTDVNLHGVPWVIGARKGFPSFNEAFWQTEVGVTRRVKLTKFPVEARYATNLTTGRPVVGSFRTNVQYLVDVTRRGSVEAWNSYAADYNRPYRLIVTNVFCLGFSNYVDGQYRSLVPDTDVNSRLLLRLTNSLVVVSNQAWPGSKTLGGSPTSFQVPIDFVSGNRSLTNHLLFLPPGALGAATAPSGQLLDLAVPANRRFETFYFDAVRTNSTPNLTVAMTNYLVYAMVDQATDRIIDFVNLKSIALETNLLTWMAVTNVGENFAGFAARQPGDTFRDGHLWMTNIVDRNAPGITAGITNQVLASSLEPQSLTADIYRPFDQRSADKLKAVVNFRYFLYRDAVEQEWRAYGDANIRTNLNMDAIAPTRRFILTDRRAINDPLVHYTLEDLRPGVLWVVNRGAGKVPGLTTNKFGSMLRQDMVGRDPRSFAPWGLAPIHSGASASGSYATDARFKDPGITRSDDWNFPSDGLPSLGWMGRVHRGTPWQTVYLKAGFAQLGGNPAVMPSGDATWSPWSGFLANFSLNYGLYQNSIGPLSTNYNSTTEPTADWNLLHLFTTAYNDNAARGLLSVNHAGEGGWAAVLSGVNVLRPNGTDTFIDPTGSDFAAIYTNLLLARLSMPNSLYTNLGGVLSTPQLTVNSPYLVGWQARVSPDSDAVVERIPQQVLGLVRQPEPYFVVYAFGQALKPAPGSLVTAPGPYYGLCQNYQITSEKFTKTVVRFDGAATNSQAIIEQHVTLPAQ